jgi:plasmid stability protein
MQYTIRGIPERLDTVLRERARAEGKSLNAIALDALAGGSA